MNGINVHQTPDGWIYEVRYMGCLIVIGCCATLAAATREASLAWPLPARNPALDPTTGQAQADRV